MRSTSFLAVLLTVFSLANLISALSWNFTTQINGCSIPLITNGGFLTSFDDLSHGSTNCRASHLAYKNQNRHLCYLKRANSSTFFSRNRRSPRFSLFGKTESVDEVIQVLYDSLKSKKTTFFDLQNRLKDAGISLDGCKKPDDVIRRVAQLEVLGKARLEDEIRKSDPKFQTVLNDVYNENLSSYRSKRGNARSDYIASLRSHLITKNVEFDKEASDEDIIRIASELESRERLEFQLPPTKPVNDGSQRIDSYKDEADSIFAVYKKIKDDKIRSEFISQIKEELSHLSIDCTDCKKNEDLINRLAYGRVFPQEEKHEPSPMNELKVQPHHDTPWDKALIDRNDPFSGLFDLGNMQGFFDLNGGMFENSQDMPSIFEGDGTPDGGVSILKDIAKMFGVDFGNNGKDRIVFENQETATNKQAGESTDDSGIEIEEEVEDDEVKSILTKAKETNDRVLTKILSKCIKDTKMRDALKFANSNGYEAAKEAYENDKSVLYILEKLYERGVFE